MEENLDKKSTESKNINYSKPVASVAINVAIIFGLPAFITTFLSQRLDWAGEKTALFMVLTFAFSWLIMITRFKKLTKKFDTKQPETEKKLQENKETNPK